jgi:hypothetical protein
MIAPYIELIFTIKIRRVPIKGKTSYGCMLSSFLLVS